MLKKLSIILGYLLLTLGVGFSQKLPPPDSLGNRVPDFSFCGYQASEKPIPDIPVKFIVAPTSGDATPMIQAAIDQLSSFPLNKDGFRGAILLQPGNFEVFGSLMIRASGIILRGSGVGKTHLIAAGKDRRTLIRVEGVNDKKSVGDTLVINDSYVPVGAMGFSVSGKSKLKVGDKIMLVRPSTKEWIKELGTDHFGGGITSLGWKPGEHNIYWDRTIVSVNENIITIDAPITTALDKSFGGGFLFAYQWNGRIENVGIENLELISEYDKQNTKDETHSWTAISIANASDAWVRNAVFRNFAGSAVYVQETAKRITVENCKSLNPVSEVGGHRRNIFFSMGQQCLFQRLYSEYGYHDFALGFCSSLNAFVQCTAYLPYSYSGPVDSWASGALFDIVNIDGNALRFSNLGQEKQGAGWNAANNVFWQCSPSYMENFAPPTAMNWAFGTWSEFQGNGYWEESNNHIYPRSLFYAQLEKRLGDKYTDRSYLLPVSTAATSSPTVEQAREQTILARKTPLTLPEWIDRLIVNNQPVNDVSEAKQFKFKASENKKENFPEIKIVNGRIVRDGVVLTGQKHKITWWNGTVQAPYLQFRATPHLTRFVPSRTGTGLTDDIDSVATWMKRNNIVVMEHNYGLWYDRRRDDHERIRRMTGDVWAPFYEQPFARSGEGKAFDGLSKYDLTKYNHWYWMRLRQFADIADRDGLILMQQNYFQHNIIEAGAHWTDSPWRTANNVNNTGFPEPAPYAGDKRIFLAEQFYDTTNVVRRDLHRAYIRQCLDNFKGNHSVIQLISEEYTGPLHFVQFWLDVIAEWERETGEHPMIALSATKDVQDAILADEKYAKVVDIIDIRYWHYRSDGTLYAPEGGQSLAPRQHARQVKPGKASAESVFRAVKEYRDKYPDKAVTYFGDGYVQYGRAVYDAGGSLAVIK